MTGKESEVGHLVGEDADAQRREWRLERWGWAAMTFVVVAGLLGLWGNGPGSQAHVESATGQLALTYQRFVRSSGQTQLVVRVLPTAVEHGVVRLRLSKDYLAGVRTQAVTPPPTTSFAWAGEHVFEFPVVGATPLLVRFDLQPTGGLGTRATTVAVAAESVAVRQLVYP